MDTNSKREEPAQRPQPPPERDTPLTDAAQAVKKGPTVRVSVAPVTPHEPDDLQEDGYGHGV